MIFFNYAVHANITHNELMTPAFGGKGFVK